MSSSTGVREIAAAFGLGLALTASVASAQGRRAGAAAAAPYVLTLNLDGAADQQPDHVCIVSASPHPDWATPQGKNGRIGPPDASLPLKELRALKLSGSANLDGKLVAASRESGRLKDWPYIADAVAALLPRPSADGCASGGKTCQPVFDVPDKIDGGSDPGSLHVACAPNLRPTGHDNPHVAVVFLNTHLGKHPSIRRITLDGGVASVEFVGDVGDDEVFIASVVGGSYVPQGTASSAQRRIVLGLTPRCSQHVVELPYYDQRSRQLRLKVDLRDGGASLMTCHADVVDGFARVSLPNLPASGQRVLDLRGEGKALHFVASWTDPAPPAALRTTLRGVSFTWNRHCLYPETFACPSADSPGLGAPLHRRAAVRRCLPLRVRLRIGDRAHPDAGDDPVHSLRPRRHHRSPSPDLDGAADLQRARG